MYIRPFLLAVLFPAASCFSQSITPSVINSGGGTIQKEYYQFEWSIGELALVNQLSAPQNSLIVSNGFLQPYILNPANYSITTFFENYEVKLFPNPATQYVEVNFFTRQKGKINLGMFDATGRKVYNHDLASDGVDLIYRIPVTNLAAGTYMLYINLASLSGYVSKTGVYKLITIR